MDPVGIIGVGLVGAAIVERLRKANYRVLGFDIGSEQMQQLADLGGCVAADASAVAAGCTRLILSLPTSQIAGTVLEQVLPQLRPGSVIIDTTTGAPEDAVRFAEMLAGHGIEYVDATIGGSSRHVREREAILICGGSKDAFDRCSDLFREFAGRAFHVGPVGSGVRMKLVMNLVLGLNRAVLAEGLSFARASGLDAATALEILRSGAAYSRAMDTKGDRMLNEQFEPEARLSQHLKDVRLILECGERSGAYLPLSKVHEELLEAAEEAGYGPADNSAVIKAYDGTTEVA
jgi:3-hydroxyisobutyrate dehydrogenase-like beta-hydroxyacid dehydrogenase